MTSMSTPQADLRYARRIMQMAWGYAPPLIIEAHPAGVSITWSWPKTATEIGTLSGASVAGLRRDHERADRSRVLAKVRPLRPHTGDAAFLISGQPGYHADSFVTRAI